MNIPDSAGWGKPEGSREQGRNGFVGHFSALSRDWLVLGCLALTATLCFALGILAAKANRPLGDSLWIEQLPKEELPGSISTTTAATAADTEGQGTLPAPAAAPAQPAAAAATLPHAGAYVASKTGTKYYLPSCATANRIKEENKVWFATKAAAEAAGYGPAANCKGL